jgi:hypothetical protein
MRKINYLLFAGNDYYPEGGACDLIGGYKSVNAAQDAHEPNEFKYDGGWANVLRLSDLKIVATFNRGTWDKKSPSG